VEAAVLIRRIIIMAAIATAASTGRAQWTNPWYSGWTNPAAGWPSLRYPKEVRAATVERQTVAGAGLTNTIPAVYLWPSRKWLRITDAALQEMAPRFVDQTELSSGTFDAWFASGHTNLPMWTFSNVCVEVGLTNGNFTRTGKNLPGWLSKGDLKERRDVVRLLQITTNTATSFTRYMRAAFVTMTNTGNLEYTELDGIWPDMIDFNETIRASTYDVTNPGPGTVYFDFKGTRTAVAGAMAGCNIRASKWQHSTNHPGSFQTRSARLWSQLTSPSIPTNYAAEVQSYVNVMSNRAALNCRYPNGPTWLNNNQFTLTGEDEVLTATFETNVTIYGVAYWLDAEVDISGDTTPDDGINLWQQVNKPTGSNTVIFTFGNTNLYDDVPWPATYPGGVVDDMWLTNYYATIDEWHTLGGYNVGMEADATGVDAVMSVKGIDENVPLAINWAVTNGFRYQ